MHELEPVLAGTVNYDQIAELASLKTWAKRVAKRAHRGALCSGLIKLIDRDVLRYGYCRSTSGVRKAFAMTGDPKIVADVPNAAWSDPVAAALLERIIRGQLAVYPGYGKGQPDLIFSPLARWLGPIHEKFSEQLGPQQ